MITLKKISLYELPELIYLCYKGDDDLLNKYHIAKLDLETAVQSTFGMIHTASRIKKISCYKVVYQKQPIGYVVTYGGNFLYSYAIAMKFRKKDILKNWWNEVKKILDEDFSSMLYSNNVRAVEFLIKNGMKVMQEDKQNQVLTFINSK